MEKPDLGQVFTKRNVADFMAGLFTLESPARILDPCFGSGVFLDSLMALGFHNLVGVELDHELFGRRGGDGCVYVQGDFLALEDEEGFDGIIMNPPYIRQEKLDGLSAFGIDKAALRSRPMYEALPSTANMYMYFVLKAISLLKPHGELVLIFPGTWKWTAAGTDFLRAIEEQCAITKWFNVRGNPFETGALVDVVILKLVRGESHSFSSARTVVFEDGKAPVILKKSEALLSGEAVLSAFEKELVPFSKVADVRRGLTTLHNKMYINPQRTEPKLDSAFLMPIVSSPKNIDGYTTRDYRADTLLVADIYETKAEAGKKKDAQLLRLGAYLERFRQSIVEEESPKTLYERITRGDKHWYHLKPVCGPGILFGYIVRREMKFISADTCDAVRDNFYIIYPKINKDIVFALLNNYYTFYQLEKRGKHYGAGVLKLQKYDIEQLFVINYEKLDGERKKELISYVNRLKDSGDAQIVEDITRLLSEYAPVDFDTIKRLYSEAKRKRLEVNV